MIESRLQFRQWKKDHTDYRLWGYSQGEIPWHSPSEGPEWGKPEHSEQWTGIHDADGVKIWEGDIIEGEGGHRHIIKWVGAAFRIVLKQRMCFSDSGPLTQSWVDEFQKKVIGNIRQNPELM